MAFAISDRELCGWGNLQVRKGEFRQISKCDFPRLNIFLDRVDEDANHLRRTGKDSLDPFWLQANSAITFNWLISVAVQDQVLIIRYRRNRPNFVCRDILVTPLIPSLIDGQPTATPNQTIRLVWEVEWEPLPDHPACQS